MTQDPTQLTSLGIIVIFFIKEAFGYFRTRKNGNGYKAELDRIDKKLGNHLVEVNGRISDIERSSAETKTDVKLIKNTLVDIKIKLENKKL